MVKVSLGVIYITPNYTYYPYIIIIHYISNIFVQYLRGSIRENIVRKCWMDTKNAPEFDLWR